MYQVGGTNITIKKSKKMKTVFYESRIAKLFTFIPNFKTIMLFGFVFTEHKELSITTLSHEKVHQRQYQDCFGAGLALAIILMFTLFALSIQSHWMFLLVLIPIFLYYIVYGVEYLISFIHWLFKHKNLALANDNAYYSNAMEMEAYDLQDEWRKPCKDRRIHHSFEWFKYYGTI